MRSLILRGGALGDFLVTLPLLQALTLTFPGGTIELVGNRSAATLAIEECLLSRVHDQNEARWAALYADAPLPAELAAFLGSFDQVISFWPDNDGTLRRALEGAVRGRLVFGAPHPSKGPAAQHYLDAAASLGLKPVTLVTRLRERASASYGVAIHPGSGSPSKNWNRAHWETVSRALSARERIVMVVGPAERPDPLKGSQETWHNLPLPRLADRLASCRLFLGHDSGVSHLAAACGVPSVLLFGPTDPAVWAPPSPGVKVLTGLSALSPEHVLDEASRCLQAAG